MESYLHHPLCSLPPPPGCGRLHAKVPPQSQFGQAPVFQLQDTRLADYFLMVVEQGEDDASAVPANVLRIYQYGAGRLRRRR